MKSYEIKLLQQHMDAGTEVWYINSDSNAMRVVDIDKHRVTLSGVDIGILPDVLDIHDFATIKRM